LIAYREKYKWATPRKIDATSVRKMDKAFPTTFNNYDYEEKRMTIAPASPCPILFGIRGDKKKDLPKAAGLVKSEPIARHIIFLTNQGTDDHIVSSSISRLKPFTSVSIKGHITSPSKIIKGGHLIFSLSNGKNVVDCTIYEPAKSFRRIGEALVPGDRLRVLGGVREKPFTINVEKMMIEKLAMVREKVANPLCRKCNKRMKSIGKGQGYRCSCGSKAREDEAEFRTLKRTISTGWYEPPVGSRRHLSKPLKRT
jgi:tRNA(Ile2)-agmatinylcytidine synthase